MKNLLKRIFGKLNHKILVFSSKLFPRQGVVYMIHHVSKNLGEFNISEKRLKQILKLLNKKIIHLEDWNKQNDFIAFSIDDVAEDFFLNGYPLFKKYNVPFTIFVNTSLLNKTGYISTSQLKELAADPLCTVGSHGTIHSEYANLSDNDKGKREFLAQSKEFLEDLIGKKVELFAFPYGSLFACGYSKKHLVSEYYRYGFGTIAAPVTKPNLLPDYFLPRINLNDKTAEKILRKKKIYG